jgi:hypothetical protein
VAATALAGFFATAEEDGMLPVQPQPAWLGQRRGSGLAMVVHERVELLDAGYQRSDARV